MDPAVFEEHRAAIAAAVKALRNNPKSRNRFRLCAVYESQSHELVAELFTTQHGPVVANGNRELWPLTGDSAQQFILRAGSRSYVVTGAHFAARAYPENLLVFKH